MPFGAPNINRPLKRVFPERRPNLPPVPDAGMWRPIGDSPADGQYRWVRNGVLSDWGYFDGQEWVRVGTEGKAFDPQPDAYLHGKVYDE